MNQDHKHNHHHNEHMEHHSHSEMHHSEHAGKVSDKTMDHKKQKHSGHSHSEHEGHTIEGFRKRFWVSVIVTIPILIISPMIHHFLGLKEALRFTGDSYVLFVLSTFVYFYGGYPFLKGLVDELKNKQPGMMTLIALAISVAYFYSSAVVFGVKGEVFFWELATLIDIMLLGHWIEMKSVMGASKALEELARLMPDEAHKIDDTGNIADVPVSELKHKDKLLIKPGEKIPADGKIYEGKTSINEAMITGESKPVSKSVGDNVIGGSINGEGSIKIEVEKIGDETFLSQIVMLVKEAQESKSKTQNLANRAAFWLTIIAISAGAITMFVWLMFTGESFNFALSRTVTVMVITCPHALGLAIPLVVAVSTALSAKHGLLIRNRNAFEQARNIQAIIFDKTGTLTKGEFGVTETISFDENFDEKEILKYAAAVESESEHPIAQGIVNSTKEKFEVKNFNSIPGKGAEGNVNGKDVKVVSPGYLEENKIEFQEKDKIEKLSAQGKTVVFVLIDNKVIGAIALADIIREESKEAIKQLKELGIKTMMLTGDNKKVAKWVADEIQLDDYFAEVLPDKKAEKVKEVQSRGMIVAMTGDGVNDAPALAQADIGIAIGTGTDVAVETADIILVKSNPKDVVSLIKFAKATYNKMVQNLIWATGYNIIAIPLAAGVLYSEGIILSPALGAVLMSLSTIIVAINARLLKIS
ncbi:heavy metal translocating P-type ATPase [Ignavibacterium sp.]|uniref:heavy metal translocating P-type ATPase n=1 Tax=Ignavibacterium sp. TaxID=2651167 RepID=UPI00220E926E|nr:heavy metal translocating P-type ATPase [Ignavibacterium sp.]BDQ04335.1 MAG: heavy metal translocating P-type ATPase [Ignavibacterium sp.]